MSLDKMRPQKEGADLEQCPICAGRLNLPALRWRREGAAVIRQGSRCHQSLSWRRVPKECLENSLEI